MVYGSSNLSLYISFPCGLWQSGCHEQVGLFYPFPNQCICYLFVIHVAPVLLVPMPSGCHGGELFTELLVPFWRQLQRQSGLGILDIVLTTAQPEAYEYLSFQSESDDVVAKRLVFCHAKERQRVFSNLFDIHIFTNFPSESP